MFSRGPFPRRFTALPGEMNRYSYSGSLNTERCLCVYSFTFTLQPPALLFHGLIKETRITQGQTDIPVESQADRQTVQQIPGQMGCLKTPQEPPHHQTNRWRGSPSSRVMHGGGVTRSKKAEGNSIMIIIITIITVIHWMSEDSLNCSLSAPHSPRCCL